MTQTSVRSFGTYSRVLANRIESAPDTPAFRWLADGVAGSEERVTWGALGARMGAMAERLRAVAAAGDRVLLLLAPGPDYVVAFLGCMWGGFVPVPAYPPQSPRTVPRLVSLSRDCGATVALADPETLASMQALFAAHEELGGLRWLAVDTSTAPLGPPADATPDSLFFLQYTSGSTSEPRGVQLSHANILSQVDSLRLAWDLGPSTRLASWLPPYHDMGLIGNLLAPLATGTDTTLMSPFDFMASPVRWLDAVSHYRIAVSGAPNFAYDLCVRRATEQDVERLDLGSWRTAVNGAEPIRKETLDRFVERFRACGFTRRAFSPGYGLAEATLGVTAAPLGTEPVVDGEGALARVSSGRRLADADVRVVVSGPRPAADGEEGEIWVAGDSVSSGYWNRVSDSFGATLPGVPGAFLRTGDLGYLRQGELFVTGRIKDLIIFRGANHYPQDLEATASSCDPRLRSGAAFETFDERGREAIVIVLESEVRLDEVALRQVSREVRRRIAEEHGIGHTTLAFVTKGTIPKTSSGKIQRQATKAAWMSRTLSLMGVSVGLDDASPTAAPQTPTEERLASAWSRVLGIAEIGRDDDFFALGGDSLQAVEAAAIAHELGMRFAPDLVYRAPTLAALAKAIDDAGGVGNQQSMDPTRGAIPTRARRSTEGDAGEPISPMQRATPTHRHDDPTKSWDDLVVLVPLETVDVPALQAALDDVVAHHAALRANFCKRNGTFYQRTAAKRTVPLALLDAQAYPESERYARVGETLRAHNAYRFDLANELLLRALLLTDGEKKPLLFLTLNFLVIDFYSTIYFREDLLRAYAARRSGKAADLPPCPVDYRDVTAWLNDLERTGAHTASREYWRHELSGVERDPLPTDREVDEHGSTKVSTCRLGIDHALATRITLTARAAGTSPTSLLLATFFDVVHARSEHDDMLIDVSLTGRDRPELRRMVGRLARHVLIRVNSGRARTYRDLTRAVHEKMFQAMAHQYWPPDRVADDLGIAKRPQRDTFTNVYFAKVDLGGSIRQARPDPFELHYEEMHTDTLPQLSLFVVGYEDGIELVFRNRTALWSRDFMVTLARDYVASLERSVDDIEQQRIHRRGDT